MKSSDVQKLRPPTGAQAVIRAIRLLKKVNSSAVPLGLGDLSRDLGLTKTTTHRILSALISEGMVQQDPSSRYFFPGPESLSMGANSSYRSDIRTRTRPFLERLAMETGESVSLEQRIDNEMFILDEISSVRVIGARAEIGTRWPMYATSSGKMILALLDQESVSDYLEVARDALTTTTLVSRSRLMKDLNTSRERGFAITMGELQPEFNAVSVALTDQLGKPIAAISVGGPAERLTRDRLELLGASLSLDVAQLVIA